MVICFLAVPHASWSQANITIPIADIKTQSNVIATGLSYGNTPFITVLGGIQVASANSSIASVNTTAVIPLDRVQIQVYKIGDVALLGSSTPIILSTTYKTLYASLLGLLSAEVFLNFTIFNNPTGWVSGSYSTPLQFSGLAVNSGKSLAINVPGFLEAVTISPTNTTISLNNALSFNSNKSGLNTLSYYHTVASQLTLSSAANLTYAKPSAYQGLPNLPVSLVSSLFRAKITGSSGLAGAEIQPGTTALSLNGTTLPIPVRSTNRRDVETTYSLTSAQLKSNFAQAGTYTLPVSYTLSKDPDAYSATTINPIVFTSNIVVVVDPFQDITAQTLSVNLDMNTAAKYNNGTTTTITNQLLTNSTVPYNVSVRATSTSFSNAGNTSNIDLDVLSIKASGSNAVTLSTTNTPLFSTSSAPELGRQITIEYAIPAGKTSKLLNKSGTHSANIVYSITGL